jgi:p-aminobenzoyl-glutamate transporter AbgT
MFNSLVIAGIVFLVLCAMVFVLAPFYWCVLKGEVNAATCCAPFIAFAIFMALGVCFIVFGEQQGNDNRLRH